MQMTWSPGSCSGQTCLSSFATRSSVVATSDAWSFNQNFFKNRWKSFQILFNLKPSKPLQLEWKQSSGREAQGVLRRLGPRDWEKKELWRQGASHWLDWNLTDFKAFQGISSSPSCLRARLIARVGRSEVCLCRLCKAAISSTFTGIHFRPGFFILFHVNASVRDENTTHFT